jgi:molybdate transport repressor ModE-like protein
VDLTHLRYFQSIAQHGSLTAAARALKVSQPTLTVAVKNLEERLGTTLLHRSREGVKLTRTGQELLDHATQIFALLDRVEERISGLQSDEVGRFVIGCHESLGAYFLPTFMRRFIEAAPRIELSLWNGTSAAVTEAVVARQVDFGLVVNPRPHPELVVVDLFADAMDIFVAAGGAGGADGAGLDAAHARLRAGPLIFAGRVGQCQELIDRLAAQSLLPTRMLSCGDLELVKSLALEGVGVALLPRRVAAYEQEGRLARLHPDLPFIPDIICLLYRGDMHRTRASMRLKDALVAHGRSLDERGRDARAAQERPGSGGRDHVPLKA